MVDFDRAIVSTLHSSSGKTGRGDAVAVIARTENTNGALGIWSTLAAPGTGPTWHVHTRETEVFYVVSGEFRFWCGTEAFNLGRDNTIVLPPKIPHQWKNIGTTAGQLFAFVTPGGFEQNFLAIAALPAITAEALAKIDAQLDAVACPAPEGAQP
jgi:mannose-6-phosphate isomerase-like protein (cupin superfamily)